jgi:hypothetical protein
MGGSGQAMTARADLSAMPATGDTVSGIEWEIQFLDPEVTALIAEVDAILSAALTAHRRSRTPPPVSGRALLRSRSARRCCGVLIRPWQRPAHLVRAVQRSPPDYPQSRDQGHRQVKGR